MVLPHRLDDWNTAAIVSKLYAIFQGTVAVKGKVRLVRGNVNLNVFKVIRTSSLVYP